MVIIIAAVVDDVVVCWGSGSVQQGSLTSTSFNLNSPHEAETTANEQPAAAVSAPAQ